MRDYMLFKRMFVTIFQHLPNISCRMSAVNAWPYAWRHESHSREKMILFLPWQFHPGAKAQDAGVWLCRVISQSGCMNVQASGPPHRWAERGERTDNTALTSASDCALHK